jgi:hypothetical protein
MFSGFDQLRDREGRSNRILDFHKRFWGDPLPPEHSDLVHDPKVEEDGDEDGEKGDGDLLPGSPIINTPWKQLLIRAEYVRLYNWVEQKYEDSTESHPPAVVITGQPGIGQYSIIDTRGPPFFDTPLCIGKSYWAYYALRRRLGENSVTLWFEAHHSLLFCSEGVLVVPPNFSFIEFGERIWALIDSSQSPSGLPSAMIETGVFPIYLTSPMPVRWKGIRESWLHYQVIMNPWTREEIKYV